MQFPKLLNLRGVEEAYDFGIIYLVHFIIRFPPKKNGLTFQPTRLEEGSVFYFFTNFTCEKPDTD